MDLKKSAYPSGTLMPGAAVTSKLELIEQHDDVRPLRRGIAGLAGRQRRQPGGVCVPRKVSGPLAGGSASIHPVDASRDTATTPERARLEI